MLLDKKTGTNLIQWPIKEVENLRMESKIFDNVQVKAGSIQPLDIGTATQVIIINLHHLKHN